MRSLLNNSRGSRNVSHDSTPIQGHFFFVDIVGLSDPEKGTTEMQIEKIKMLHNFISECEAYMITREEQKYVNLTGDGMVIGFLERPDLPLDIAIELQKKLRAYNKNKKPVDKIEVRVGIDSAPILFYVDIFQKKNVWGDGIVVAKRVMDLGSAGHILLSARSAEGLKQFGKYKNYIKEIGPRFVKHGVTIRIYSAYGRDFGNSAIPEDKLAINDQNAMQIITKGQKYWLTSLLREGYFNEPKPIREIQNRLTSDSHYYELSDLTQPLDDMIENRDLRKIRLVDMNGKKVWHWVKW